MFQISQRGMNDIKLSEGFRSKAYLDSAGIPTIGYGTIRINGVPVKMGMVCTIEEAERYLRQDLKVFEMEVNKAIAGVPTTQNEYDALVNICYNIGVSNFRSSTFLKRHKAGDKIGCAKAFEMWCKVTVNGRKVTNQGLLNRRIREADMYLRGIYQSK
jgi:lysozyme